MKLFLLNLLAEVFLVFRAARWCDGSSVIKRKLWGLVFSLMCFEQLSPGSASAVPSGRVVGEMCLLPAPLMHQCGFFGFWVVGEMCLPPLPATLMH